MPLTPADIHHAEFGKATIGRRGYDEEQVDALLDEVSQQMVALLDENDLLQKRRAGRVDAPAVDDGAARAEFSALTAQLDRARRDCEQAEQRARLLQRQLSEARKAAAAAPAPVLGDKMAGKVMEMAQRTADDHLHEARRQSHALAAEARDQSERVTREAHQVVHDIEQDMARRQAEAVAELETTDAALKQQIEELSSFADGYRAALKKHLVQQSDYLEGPA